jgi:hypothetical protein
VGAIRAQPYDRGELPLLLIERGCWQEICVDVTTRAEALRTLNTSDWVGEIFQTDLHISWRWSGAQPALIDASQDGLLRVQGGVVRQVRVRTHIPFGDVWMSLRQPDDALLVRPVSRFSAYQIALYEEEGVQTISTIRCPTSPYEFWNATTTFGFGELWLTDAINSIQFDIYGMESWWESLRRCRP